MTSHIVRVSRSDSDDFVILHITCSSRNELDIDIEGTEGTTPFASTFKYHKIARALSEQSNLTDEQWKLAVRHLFLQQTLPDDTSTDELKNLQLSAYIAGNRLVLAVRRNISGIQQRVAELSLPKDEDRELDTLAWVSTAAVRAHTLSIEIQSLVSTCSRQKEAISALEKQLEELVQAKAEHEHDLLDKFSQLLNAKKLKIRNQQRVITDKSKEQLSLGTGPRGPTSEATARHQNIASPSRGKRKARQDVPADAQSTQLVDHGSDHSFEKGLVPGQMTPDRSDEDDTSDEDGRLARASERVSHFSTQGATSEMNARGSPDGPKDNADPDQPPPRRILPFNVNAARNSNDSRSGKQTIERKDQNMQDVADASTDDEL